MSTSTQGDYLRLFITRWVNEESIQPHDIKKLHKLAELLDSYHYFHQCSMVFLGRLPAEPSPGLSWSLYQDGKKIQHTVSALLGEMTNDNR